MQKDRRKCDGVGGHKSKFFHARSIYVTIHNGISYDAYQTPLLR